MWTSHGQSVWCELITPDAPSSISFYGIMGPNQVPGGSWIAQCLDPHKILFAMVAPTPACQSPMLEEQPALESHAKAA